MDIRLRVGICIVFAGDQSSEIQQDQIECICFDQLKLHHDALSGHNISPNTWFGCRESKTIFLQIIIQQYHLSYRLIVNDL